VPGSLEEIQTDRSYFTSPVLNTTSILHTKIELLLEKNMWSISSGNHGHKEVEIGKSRV
jgi:hypothetical protein